MLSVLSLRFSLLETLYVMKLTSIKLNDAIVYIFIKNNCAFPGISQATRGMIAKIWSPLIMPQRSPNAEPIRRLIPKFPNKTPYVLLFALSVLATIPAAAPRSWI